MIIKRAYHFLTKERNLRNFWKENRNKKGIVVCYHYVNDRQDGFWKNLHKIKPDSFRKQIEYFKGQKYNFIGMEDYVNFLEKGVRIPDNFCILTFDDGLRDHYDNVFPVLKEFGIKGCFFPLPKSLDGKILPVHKIHILLAESRVSDKDLAKEININLKEIAPEKFEEFKIDTVKKMNLDRQKRMNEKYKMDGVLRTNLKYNLNVMDDGLKNTILDNIFSVYFKDEANIADSFYLNMEQMKKMSKDGMEFGAHTINHPRLALLDKEQKELEIAGSKKMLEEILEKKVTLFSYPFGSFDGEIIKICKKCELRGAVTIKSRWNIGLVDRFLINRIDANNFLKEI